MPADLALRAAAARRARVEAKLSASPLSRSGRVTIVRRGRHEPGGSSRLVGIRNEVRHHNLHDMEEPPLERQETPPDLDPLLREPRTVDGAATISTTLPWQLRPAGSRDCGHRRGRSP